MGLGRTNRPRPARTSVEVGQILFVLGVLALGRAAGRLPGRLPGWARRAPVYGMGSLAGFWFLERALALMR